MLTITLIINHAYSHPDPIHIFRLKTQTSAIQFHMWDFSLFLHRLHFNLDIYHKCVLKVSRFQPIICFSIPKFYPDSHVHPLNSFLHMFQLCFVRYFNLFRYIHANFMLLSAHFCESHSICHHF